MEICFSAFRDFLPLSFASVVVSRDKSTQICVVFCLQLIHTAADDTGLARGDGSDFSEGV